ncbi:CidA/LrgA family protein [Aureimonas fodinaquatilis]|uniref:CidA/LrgA family protein n=2 Tax=Aureimonas fodinaquatilis TaxID=2565783 RepID=A0A5B0DTI2_9HYPH|nr:CidA/LrgA family protein [Aureimonas fodinaquatilis]
MLKPIAVLLSCQLVGEAISRGLNLPLPGPVLGLALLFLLLLWRGERETSVLAASERGAIGGIADRILAILGLLFVPAGVGMIDHLGILSTNAPGFVSVLVASVFLTLLVTVLVFLGVERLTGKSGESQ